MQGFPDDEIRRRVASSGPSCGPSPPRSASGSPSSRPRLDARTLAAADLSNGRKLFVQVCANCHTLFGTGGKIGPDLTGAQRSDLGYLLENIVDPAATVAADYRMSTVALADGRLLNGIVGDHGGTGPTLTLQTATERLVVNRGDVEEIRASDLSLMPDGLLDVLDRRPGPRPDRLPDVAAAGAPARRAQAASRGAAAQRACSSASTT